MPLSRVGATRRCAEWLVWCNENGWSEHLGALADMFWRYHPCVSPEDRPTSKTVEPPDTGAAPTDNNRMDAIKGICESTDPHESDIEELHRSVNKIYELCCRT